MWRAEWKNVTLNIPLHGLQTMFMDIMQEKWSAVGLDKNLLLIYLCYWWTIKYYILKFDDKVRKKYFDKYPGLTEYEIWWKIVEEYKENNYEKLKSALNKYKYFQDKNIIISESSTVYG